MYKKMRRSDKALSPEETRALLDRCEYGVLATADADGQPYALPISYAVLNDAIYIHSALHGQKIDNLKANPKVCFSVVADTQPVWDNDFTTYYTSCVVYGKARLVTDEREKRDALIGLVRKYLPEHMDKAEEIMAQTWKSTLVYAISLEHVTGKAKKRKAS
ncbi:MAG: pyridoxamine 5'-phosphate oxidase family protein [Deltaproteobacteria bacterium]|jgi:nitroimidazol reductase NimA-like FMN-containing flavoprotein (pyridoxamine 5'-phosphate oxidase superfamily)|nr:pyridoxamine 5'-phosphate oxidase family protein [Deltaproteobacteria bacterium]